MAQYFFGMTQAEKNNILDQHKTIYDGYVTQYAQGDNQQPLYVQDFANDKQGLTVSNKGVVKPYTNMGINESELPLDMIGDGEDDLINGTVDIDGDTRWEDEDIEYISLGLKEGGDMDDYENLSPSYNSNGDFLGMVKPLGDMDDYENLSPSYNSNRDMDDYENLSPSYNSNGDFLGMVKPLGDMDNFELEEGFDSPLLQRLYKDYSSEDYEDIPSNIFDPGSILDPEGTRIRKDDNDDDFDEDYDDEDDFEPMMENDFVDEVDEEVLPDFTEKLNESLDMFRRFKKYN
jgi:hypothetical protein